MEQFEVRMVGLIVNIKSPRSKHNIFLLSFWHGLHEFLYILMHGDIGKVTARVPSTPRNEACERPQRRGRGCAVRRDVLPDLDSAPG